MTILFQQISLFLKTRQKWYCFNMVSILSMTTWICWVIVPDQHLLYGFHFLKSFHYSHYFLPVELFFPKAFLFYIFLTISGVCVCKYSFKTDKTALDLLSDSFSIKFNSTIGMCWKFVVSLFNKKACFSPFFV